MFTKEEIIDMLSNQVEFEKEMIKKTKNDYWKQVLSDDKEKLEMLMEE